MHHRMLQPSPTEAGRSVTAWSSSEQVQLDHSQQQGRSPPPGGPALVAAPIVEELLPVLIKEFHPVREVSTDLFLQEGKGTKEALLPHDGPGLQAPALVKGTLKRHDRVALFQC